MQKKKEFKNGSVILSTKNVENYRSMPSKIMAEGFNTGDLICDPPPSLAKERTIKPAIIIQGDCKPFQSCEKCNCKG